MARVNVYDRSPEGNGDLIGWFERTACTEVIEEDTEWDGENRRGVLSGLQVGYEMLLRTARGRWVRYYNSRNEYNGPEYHEFIDDDEARKWLMKNDTMESEEVLEKYFGTPEEETGPSKGGRPRVGEPISVAFPEHLLVRIDAAAERAGLSRAAWLRTVAAAAASASEADA